MPKGMWYRLQCCCAGSHVFSAHEMQQERGGKRARGEWPLFHFHFETHDEGLGHFSVFFREYIFQSNFIKFEDLSHFYLK